MADIAVKCRERTAAGQKHKRRPRFRIRACTHLPWVLIHKPLTLSARLRGEREGPSPKGWEGEVGSTPPFGMRGSPHLTPTLSAPKGGEGDVRRPKLSDR